MTSETRNTTTDDKISTKCFREEVDIVKVNKIFVKRWLIDKLQEHVPDDDIAVEFIYELLVGAEQGKPEISVIRSYMDEILGKKESTRFCVQLWQLLLSAQKSRNGIPKELLEERMKALSSSSETGSKVENEKVETGKKSEVNAGSMKNGKTEDLTEDVDEKALQEANHILEALRPKTTTSKNKSRVEKPKRKTNYNRG